MARKIPISREASFRATDDGHVQIKTILLDDIFGFDVSPLVWFQNYGENGHIGRSNVLSGVGANYLFGIARPATDRIHLLASSLSHASAIDFALHYLKQESLE